ncbi:MAG: hypothetical protein AAF085_06595 [Planctomycetota bacterium]
MDILTLALGGYVLIGFLLLLIACLVVGITLWTTGGRSKGSGEMSCGACGYPVRGLEALNCPECGADLRVAGINRSKGSATTGVGIVLTTISALLLLGCVGSAFFWISSGSSSGASVPSQAVPSVQQSTTTPQPGSSSPIDNPDGSKIVTHADGSQTLIQPDGTKTTFDSDGVEILKPEADDTSPDSTPPTADTP